MKFRFEASSGLIIVFAAISKQTDVFLNLALDTGANRTVISYEAMATAGFEIGQTARQYELATGGGKILVPEVVLPKIYSLGAVKQNLPIFVHNLPSSAQIDGVLGLDFLRGHILTVDFKIGEITFE